MIFLASDYQSLFKNSTATVFQAPLWLHHFYRDLVPAVGVVPVIVTVRQKQTGELVALLPLVRRTYIGLNSLEPADLGVSDYNRIVARSDIEGDLTHDDALREALLAIGKKNHMLFYRKVPQEVTCLPVCLAR